MNHSKLLVIFLALSLLLVACGNQQATSSSKAPTTPVPVPVPMEIPPAPDYTDATLIALSDNGITADGIAISTVNATFFNAVV